MQLEQIEAELKYCPRCGEEYRPEISQCAACSLELIQGARLREILAQQARAQGERSLEIAAGEELVTIRQGPLLQIKALQAYLIEHSLPSLIAAETQAGCTKGCCGSEVLLQVRLADLEEVLAVLAQEHQRSTGLAEFDTTHSGAVYDPTAAEATCPACGSCFSTQSTVCPECGLCFA
ncbi:zinc ribbon-containing (seleno)protein DG [Desulfogranum mediterraneum]|uniref:zinc ribbon-containing (seleno)protein DG n=1 Tax=Desulfogranum mediterraneum TaxID=160661 RepID=UPI00040165D6|nr:hypothetical protein [Desulfogranum mediterraneum]